MHSLKLALTALWWRRGLSAAILLVASITTLSASIGPFYSRAAADSVLRDTLRHAPPADSGVEVYRNDTVGNAPLEDLQSRIPEQGRLTGFADSRGTVRAAVLAIKSGATAAQINSHTVAADLVARDGACEQLVWVAGRCPAATGQVAVSQRSAARYHWPRGTQISLDPGAAAGGGATAAVLLVGIYRPRDPAAPYWYGHNYFQAHLGSGDPGSHDTIDTIFVAPSELAELGADQPVRASVELPIDAAAVHLTGVKKLRSAVSALTQIGASDSFGAATTQVSTGLPSLLDRVDRNRRLLDVGVLAVTLQLAVLSWFVLFLIIATTTEARAGEVALAKLHGLPPRATVAFGLLEPVLLLCAATPLGVLLARLVVGWNAATVLSPGTAVEFRLPVAYAALAALAGGLVAAVLAGRQALTRPVLEQLARSGGDRAGSRRGSLFVDAVVIALAVAGLAQITLGGAGRGGRPDSIALVAPGLLTLAVALLAIRLLPLVLRSVLRRTRRSTQLPRFLAYRQIVRRPALLRLVVLLALATGLATFAVDASTVAARNRQQRAAFDVGADRVLAVNPPSAQALLQTVRKLDPAGRAAMAALVYSPTGDDPSDRTGTLLAVDSSRLASVMTWRRDFGPDPLSALARRLHPAVVEPVGITDGSLRVSASVSGLAAAGPPVTVTAVLSGSAGSRTVLLGRLTAGTRDYSGQVRGCAGGCRLVGIELTRGLGDFRDAAAHVAFTGIDQRGSGSWQPVAARLTDPSTWRPLPVDQPGVSQITGRSGSGLAYSYAVSSADVAGIAVIDAPRPLPAVFTAAVAGARAPGAIRGPDSSPLATRSAATVGGLPGVAGPATMVDLEYALRESGPIEAADYRVWLSARAPASFAARLQAAGVAVLSEQSIAARRTELNRSGPALALLLFLLVAAAAALLAAGATLVTLYLSGRRRAFEIAAMLAVGVSRATMRRTCRLEQALLLATGLVVGALCGLVGAQLALPSVPQFVDTVAVPKLLFTPNIAALVLLLGSFGAVVAVTTVASAALLVRSAYPSRLREAAP